MPRLSVSLRLFLAGLAVGLVVIAAIVLPLLSARDIREQVREGHSLAAVNCWGCAPYDRLRSLFRLQEVAAEPQIRQFERRLETRHLTLNERQQVQVDLRLAQAKFDAAEAARNALDRAIEACAANAACRRTPDAFHALTCTGEWPDAETRDTIASYARRIYAAGAGCREMSCPSVACGPRADLQAMMDELTVTFAGFAAAPGRGDISYAAITPVIAGLRQALERLPLVITEPNAASYATWAAYVTDSGILQTTDEWSNGTGADVGWRLRMVRLQLATLVALEPGDAGPDWRVVAERAGGALAQVHYLEWRLSFEGQADACETPETDVIAELATDLRRAAAALSVCGARAGCEDASTGPPLVDLYDRAPSGLGGLERFTTEAVAIMARNFDAMDLRPDDPVAISTDLEAYGMGEAIRASFGDTGNRCIAEPGARLGMFSAGDSDEPIEMRDVRATGDHTEALIAAPEQAGVFEIRAFASPLRGGAELARERIIVERPPLGCDGFSGLWDTNFGELRLYVRNGIARGTYGRSPDTPPGFLTGEVRGPVLYGDWSSELGDGGARLVLADESGAFRGAWSHIPGRYTGTGAWNGSCVDDLAGGD